MKQPISFILFALIIISCKKQLQTVDHTNQEILFKQDSLQDRLIITGDFDGDKQKDTLKESYYSSILAQEIRKIQSSNFDSSIIMANHLQPISNLISKRLHTLKLDRSNSFGLLYLRNEGDLNHDGTDEVGLIIDWADYSSVNTYRLYTYQNAKWSILKSFEIREFDVLELKKNESLLHSKKGLVSIKTYVQGESIEQKLVFK